MSRTLLGVLGFPLGHTRSPAMQNAALAELGLGDWRYLALPVSPELFDETVRGLPASGFRGANVTMPHKDAALALADEASEVAHAVGAANTLTFDEGAIEADNTDVRGLLEALGEPPAGRALVLGAGGAARAAIYALREGGADEVAVWNRTPERAREIATALGVEHVERPSRCDLLVNATSVGLAGESEGEALAALELTDFDPPAVVVDLVYGEGDTPLIAWGKRGGAEVVDGLEVLVRQGALSLAHWTGLEPPLDAMREAIRSPA